MICALQIFNHRLYLHGVLRSILMNEAGHLDYVKGYNNAHPYDFRGYLDEENHTVELNSAEPCRITLSVSIRFPMEDYERLLDIVGG